jgi:lysophospholipase L1-like esterase
MSDSYRSRATAGARVRRALLTVTVAGSAAFAIPAVISPTHAGAVSSTPHYLSLGDSLSQGVQPNRRGVDKETTAGYANDLYALERVSTSEAGLALKKLGCPGETTTSMISGGICTYTLGSQLAQAVQYLATHTVNFITIDIGANDIDNCVVGLTIDPTCVSNGIATVETNLPIILTTLETAAPGVPIYAMNYYDPFLAAWLTGVSGEPLAVESACLTTGYDYPTACPLPTGFDGILGAIYGAFSVPVADVATAFDTNNFALDSNTGLPQNVTNICHDTWECYPPPRGNNIHANPNGYALIANTFGATIGNL